MRRTPALAGCAALVSVLLCAVAACTSGAGAPRPSPVRLGARRTPPVERIGGPGTWRTLRVAVTDPGTGGHRLVLVYTPRVTDTGDLPVLYLLHGLPGQASALCNTTSGRILDAAFRAGARPFVLACPDGNPFAGDDSEWADAADGKTTLETYVVEQVRRAVEARHPRPPGMRAIGGFSMGGFAAASLGLRHFASYRQVVCLAGYFHLDDPDGVFGVSAVQRAQHDPSALVTSARGQRWDLVQATGDQLPLTRRAAAPFAPVLRSAGATVALSTTPGTHSNRWAIAQLSRVARFLSAGWRDS